jgi:exodeoxyribonuclease-3
VRFTITTWNINSVRLRIDLVRRFLAEAGPDILCLQETKCPDDRFPAAEIREAGYPHLAIHGQKGYHGVAIASRLPFRSIERKAFCGKADARHVAVVLGPDAGPASGLAIHDFYVPAGGDIADPDVNEKFAHKLQFLREMHEWGLARRSQGPGILVGDLNVAPLEHDVWSHKQLLDVVSHTPVETQALEALRVEAGFIDVTRSLRPPPEKIYTWWSYRSPDWSAADKGRRLDHVWASEDLAGTVRDVAIAREVRGWDRPSDHVPLTVTLDL